MPQEYIYSQKFQEGVHFEQESQFAEPPHSLKDATEPDHLVRLSQLAGMGGGGGGDSYLTKLLNTLYPTAGERIGLGGITEAESNVHIALETGDDVYITVEPDNYETNYPGAIAGQRVQQRWRYGSHRFEGVNADGRPNVVHSFGYNAGTAGGRENANDAGWQMRHESHYQIYGGSGFFEFHFPEVYSTDGRWTRVISHYIDKANGGGFTNVIIPVTNYFYNKPTIGELYQYGALASNATDGTDFRLLSENPTAGVGVTCIYTLDGNTDLGAGGFRLIQGDVNDFRISSLNALAKQNRVTFVTQAVDFPFDNGIKKMLIRNDAQIVAQASLLIGTAGYPNGVISSSALEGGSWEAPHVSAVIEVRSTTKGARPYPLMTTAEFTAIASKVKGLTAFSENDNGLLFYDGTRITGFRYNGAKFQGYDGAAWSDLN